MSAPHPYTALPDRCFWSRLNAAPGPVDPVASVDLVLDTSTRIATAGSCFAQHIARHLRAAGFAVMDTEPAHPVISPDVAAQFGHGVYSARYGNIYTARQLLQLAQRATGAFTPAEDVWTGPEGSFIDPFRPTIQPCGFADADALTRDREGHLAAVRRLFAEAEVLIFTLGLTEAWCARADGAVFPLAPGVVGGRYDPEAHAFVNFDVDDVVRDMRAALDVMRADNPDLQVILTVSPVPLAATARADQSVITASSYSKAVLRVAAERLVQQDNAVHYFPSYEIITGAHARGRYFAKDLRQVERAGVRHVMEVFTRHHAPEAATTPPRRAAPPQHGLERALDVICDESALDAVPA